MTGVRIDLHVHSSASDGTDAPAQVIRRAAQAGLDVLALSDHDTQAGVAQARAALPDGLTLVPAMELSCVIDRNQAGEQARPSAHLLAFMVDPDDLALGQETERLRDDRVYRAKAMVAKLQETWRGRHREQSAASPAMRSRAVRIPPWRHGGVGRRGEAERRVHRRVDRRRWPRLRWTGTPSARSGPSPSPGRRRGAVLAHPRSPRLRGPR